MTSRLTSKEPIGCSPLAHARYLHDSGNEYVIVGQKTDRDPWIENSYQVEKLYEVLPNYAGLNDVYLSLNRFYGSRKRLAKLSALYSDLDYYNVSELAHMSPEGIFTLALESLEQAKIPHPSLAMSTGRGLALVWRHEPEPGNVLSKWVLCQQHIFEALKPLGADPKAKDAARVFRLAGTYNSKSGTLVQSIFENLDDVWEFGDLADEILPLTGEQWKQHKAQLLAQEAEKEAVRGARTASEGQRDGRKGFALPYPPYGPPGRLMAPTRASGDGQTAAWAARLLDVRCRLLDELPDGPAVLGEGAAGTGREGRRLERGRDQEQDALGHR